MFNRQVIALHGGDSQDVKKTSSSYKKKQEARMSVLQVKLQGKVTRTTNITHICIFGGSNMTSTKVFMRRCGVQDIKPRLTLLQHGIARSKMVILKMIHLCVEIPVWVMI